MAQPRMIPNPLYCERCEGRGYLVTDAEWEPYAVQCPNCKHKRAPQSAEERKIDDRSDGNPRTVSQ